MIKHNANPAYINDFSNALLDNFYLRDGETFNDAIAATASAFSNGDSALAQRLYDAAHKGHFMFASPVLSNSPRGMWTQRPTTESWLQNTTDQYWVGEHPRDMPISCYAVYVPDTIDGQMDASREVAALSVAGGGVGLHNGIRAVSTKAPGPIPYMKTMDALIGYYQQSSHRRGAVAMYLDVNHPDIIEHIRFRVPGGDSSRKSDNTKQFHSGVNITDEFIEAVTNDTMFDLKCPHTGEVHETVRARKIWETILETRALTGEPYLFKIDTANRALPQAQQNIGLKVNGSNICSEITLPTNAERTFVCCLSSLNLEHFDEWKDSGLVGDLVTMLDNVIQYFIENAGSDLQKAKFAAYRERAIGIGTMGWHYYLMSKNIPFEGGGFDSAIQHTHIIYKTIKEQAVAQSEILAASRGEAPDMKGTGRRNSHLLAIAPNSNNAVIAQSSPCIEPISGNAYMQSTRAGTFMVRNPYLGEELAKVAANLGHETTWIEQQWENIAVNGGSVQHLHYLSDETKAVYRTSFELDQHWLVEQADARQQYVCQSQSLNLFFPSGVSREYYNSVHLKAMQAPYIKGVYYARSERSGNADSVKHIERRALQDWSAASESDECMSCSG